MTAPTKLDRPLCAELLVLAEKATPEPWRVDTPLLAEGSSHIATLSFRPNCSVYTSYAGLTAARSEDDAAFIAAAPTIAAQLALALGEVDRLREDAERYQHMRNSAAFRDRNGPGLYWYLPRWMSGGPAEQLDAAIDAARKEPKP